jgi:hypothetical protein
MQREQADKLEELKAKQENDRQELESSHMAEFQDFNSLWEKRLENHKSYSDEQVESMTEKQQNEMIELNKTLESQIPLQPKNSSELLNLIKIKNGLVKLKEYGDAHKVQQRINFLTDQEANNWANERKKKIMQHQAHLSTKHEIDLKALKKRLNAVEDELKKTRSLEMEKLLQKFQNIKKELQNYQIQEINKFNHQRHN